MDAYLLLDIRVCQKRVIKEAISIRQASPKLVSSTRQWSTDSDVKSKTYQPEPKKPINEVFSVGMIPLKADGANGDVIRRYQKRLGCQLTTISQNIRALLGYQSLIGWERTECTQGGIQLVDENKKKMKIIMVCCLFFFLCMLSSEEDKVSGRVCVVFFFPKKTKVNQVSFNKQQQRIKYLSVQYSIVGHFFVVVSYFLVCQSF